MTFREIRRENYKWATSELFADADDLEPYTTLKLQQQRIAARLEVIQQELITGGRRRRRQTKHAEFHRDILKQYFGKPAEIDENGVVHKRRTTADFQLKDFHNRFRMSPDLFQTIYDDIRDPMDGSSDF